MIGGGPRFCSRSRVNRGKIPAISPIPAKSGFPDFRVPKSRPNRDRGKIPIIFPIPVQSGSGKSRLFSRPNRGGTGRGFGVCPEPDSPGEPGALAVSASHRRRGTRLAGSGPVGGKARR